VQEWVAAVFRDFHIERFEIVGDEVIALDAAFHGGPGILQIAGTGSNTVGRAPDGSRERAGGWSSRLGDEGSGYWIGVNALRRALHAYDREQPTEILTRVAELWGTKTLDELINVGDGTPAPDFAALAPVVDELAAKGDAVAIGVLEQAAADLVEFVLLVRQKMRAKHEIEGEVPVAWTGSVIEKTAMVREAFFAGLKAAAPAMPVMREAVVPLDGAVWRAERLAGQPAGQSKS
jgi:N-acetylglucosamine kinase-like BadF-type ATPase